MKKLITSFLYIIIAQLAFGQNNWSKQNNTYFIYAEGSSSRFRDEKILLVSSHIITFDNFSRVYSPHQENMLSLGFIELRDKIELDEQVASMASYYNIDFGPPNIESFTGGSYHSSDMQYKITNNDSKITAMEKKRQAIILGYIDKGYKVYQVNFNPMNYDGMRREKDDDDAPLVFQSRSKLSELWIPRYIPGEIKRRMTYLRDQEEKKSKVSSASSTGKTTDMCSSAYVIKLVQSLESTYSSYKNGQLALGARDKLMGEARQILSLCPYSQSAQNILNSLEREQQVQTEMISGTIESSIRYEIEFARSIFKYDSENLEGNNIGHDFSFHGKLYWGIPEIAFVLGAGLSQERYPAYVFTYSDSEGLPSDFPKPNKPYDIGSILSLDGTIGLGGIIPVIKNKRSGIPRLGMSYEGLAFLKYGMFNEMTIKSHFPDIKKSFTTAFRAKAGMVLGVSDDFGLGFNFGFEKFSMGKEAEGVIQNLSNSDGSTAVTKYNAVNLNPKSDAMFFGISLIFGY